MHTYFQSKESWVVRRIFGAKSDSTFLTTLHYFSCPLQQGLNLALFIRQCVMLRIRHFQDSDLEGTYVFVLFEERGTKVCGRVCGLLGQPGPALETCCSHFLYEGNFFIFFFGNRTRDLKSVPLYITLWP